MTATSCLKTVPWLRVAVPSVRFFCQKSCYLIITLNNSKANLARKIIAMYSASGAAWGNYCDLCPEPGSEAYRQLCPGGPGYQPVLEPVRLIFICFVLQNFESFYINLN